MALRYRVLLAAKHELASAAAYHEERREGFGLELFDEYDAVIERALKFPNSGTRVALKSGFEPAGVAEIKQCARTLVRSPLRIDKLRSHTC